MRNLALFLLITALLGGCTRGMELDENLHRLTSSVDSTALTAFPRLRVSRHGETMEALGHGRLELENGCLRLAMRDGSRLIVWPASAIPAPDGRSVMDATTGDGVRVGEEVLIGGGEVAGIGLAGLDATVPPQCRGPYWVAGGHFFKAPEEGWRTVRMSGPFTARLPADMVGMELRGIDTLVDGFERPGLRLTFDYGAMACGMSSGSAATGHALSTTYVDQRRVEIDRFAEAGESGRRVYRLEARFRGLEHGRRTSPATPTSSCLTLFAECASAADCDVARAVVSTIAFGPATREEAIAAVLARRPELAVYRTASLPPHSIEAERGPAGDWRVAFIQSGSGIDSILYAECYAVSPSGAVELSGTFRRPPDRLVRRLDFARCIPSDDVSGRG